MTPRDKTTSGQHGPESNRSKFHQESKRPRPSSRLRREDEAPPKGEKKAADPKADKRFEKTGKKAEKTGARLEAAKEKLAAQRPVKRPGPAKLAAAAAGHQVHRFVHGKIHEVEHENVGVEAAHRVELAGEGMGRTGARAIRRRIRQAPARRVRRWERRDIRAKAVYEMQKQAREHPELKKNILSRYWQKQKQKREYAKRTRETAKTGAQAVKETAVTAGRIVESTVVYVKRHPVGMVIALFCALLLVSLQSCLSTMVTLGNGTITAVTASTYPSEDGDMLAAEAAYVGMENELRSYLESYEQTHDYDEYHFDLDDIEHDPYVLISAVTALMGREWTISEVGSILDMLFEKQYILTETVTTETRYRTETRTGYYTDAEGNLHSYEYTVQVPYTYYICTVKLENFNLSHVPVYITSQDQLSLYAMYMATLGNRPDLFGSSEYIGKYYTADYEKYEIPPEALEDAQFAAIIKEAEKYLGYPYIWGGSSPATSFDCSGFVSYVYNNCGVGWSFGRLGAEGLRQLCTRVSAANVRPGDLVFFQGTYDTTGASHVGIYVGNNMMLHCGDPIQYASLNSSYWQSHFLAYGRVPAP